MAADRISTKLGQRVGPSGSNARLWSRAQSTLLGIGFLLAVSDAAARERVNGVRVEVTASGAPARSLRPPQTDDPTRPGRISFGAMSPWLKRFELSYGVTTTVLNSELRLGTGWVRAEGKWAQGTSIGNAPARDYSVRGIPLWIGWRATPEVPGLGARLRPLLGTDVGGQFGYARYGREGAEEIRSDWGWQMGLRGWGGLHLDIVAGLGLRVFFDGTWSRSIRMAGAPAVGLTGWGFGAGLTWIFDRAGDSLIMAPPARNGDEGVTIGRQTTDDERFDRAGRLLREADTALRRRRYAEAAESYRRAVRLLPRDETTRENLEVPVRVDWAKALVAQRKFGEATRVLDEALRILPQDPGARALRRSLPESGHLDNPFGPGELVP